MKQSSISYSDALKLAGAFLLAYMVFVLVTTLKAVLLIFFTSVIVAIAMDQLIARVELKGIPRKVSAALLYLTVVLSLVLLALLFIPPLIDEVRNLSTEYANYSEGIISPSSVERFDITPYVVSLSTSIAESPAALATTIARTFSSFTTFLAVFFIAFFLTIQKGGVRSFVYPFVAPEYHETVSSFWDKLEERVGNWLWGKTLSSLIVAGLTFAGLSLLQIPYALILSLLALFLNFIPFVGPLIAAIPAILLGLAISPFTAGLVGLLYFISSTVIEEFILSPIFMRKAIEVNPAFLILSVISGAYLGGVLGIIISIPVAAILYLTVTEYRNYIGK